MMKYQENKDWMLSMFHKKQSWCFLICLGLIIKVAMFPVRLGDYNFYLEPWMNFIKANGYASSLKYDFYNYTPSYIYILIVLAKIGFNPLYSIKIVSILFEYVVAYFVGKIAYLKYGNDIYIWISLAVVPLLPSVLLNAAFWGQCDSIYSAFVLASIYFVFKEKKFLSILLLGFAFAFKLQAVFILPFYFIMLLRGKIKWCYFLLIPAIYFLTILPTWFYGRPMSELLTIYVSQSNYYELLTVYFPNLYIWINNDFYEPVKYVGYLFTILITLVSGIIFGQKKYYFTFEAWIKLAFLSLIIVPFILPGMHERYLYLGDVFAVLYFLVFKRNFHISLGIVFLSFYSYISCSRYKEIVPLWPAFFVYLLVIVLLVKDFVTSINKQNGAL